MSRSSIVLVLVLVPLASCGDTGQDRVQIPLSARGAARSAIAVGNASFTLARAEVGFGPLYLCATEGADVGLCDVDLGELLETVTIDGLSAEPVAIGTLEATTGSVRSALYDYGVSWLLTQQAPRPSAGAPSGHSAILEGEVEREGAKLTFLAAIDIEPLVAGDAAVNALSTKHEISRRKQTLTVALDPYRWLARINVDKLFALDDDGDGRVSITEDTQAYQAIVQGMTNGAPVALEWDESP